jgi:ABC-2 type transport system permease protein
LGLLIAQPIARDRIVRDKFLALVFWTAFLPFGMIGVLFIGNVAVGLGLSGTGITCANIGLALVALLFGTLAFAVGCATGRPALARGIAIGAAIATFLLNGLGSYLSFLAPLRMLSPFAWLLRDGPPLAHGLGPSMLAAPAVIVALYLWGRRAFRRRDLGC